MMQRVRTATVATVRDINRPILLRLVRIGQPISRAELSRRTGMFRSNVSFVIDDLVREGLLVEERAKPHSRGRVPTLLRLNDDAFPVFGVYVQPALTHLAFAGLRSLIHQQWSFETPADPAEFVERLTAAIVAAQEELGRPARALAIAIPGFVRGDSGRIVRLPALPAWDNFPLAATLEERLGIPVSADNDSNLGALSELRLAEEEQQSEAASSFVLVSVGDHGLGAGLVLNGELYRGHDTAFAGEFGHMSVDVHGVRCPCGRRGCLERYVSNEATWRRFRGGRSAGFDHARFLQFLETARGGEPRAREALLETGRYLAAGLANIVYALNPARIIVAGELTSVWDLVREPIEETIGRIGASTQVRVARRHGESSHLYGAICLALAPVLAAGSLPRAK